MQKLSFKNRIASYYIITTALLIFAVFALIYLVVRFNIYNHLKDDITTEVLKHLDEIKVDKGRFYLTHKEEWNEREHNTIDVNPIFIQFIDQNKKIVEKSPNLKNSSLCFNPEVVSYQMYDATLADKIIRQAHAPIMEKGTIIGYVIVAMSLENHNMLLDDLSKVFLISYPLILLVLFFIARLIAGRSIQPISSMIAISNAITKDNLKSRIPLPKTKDELYVLSKTINNLLDRLEKTIEREKHFTSDASHELRTPLTIIKGTLEVLIRKPRSTAEYEEKITFCVNEVNRLNHLVDQLLLLARYENEKQSVRIESVNLNALILEVVARQSFVIEAKKIEIVFDNQNQVYGTTDAHLLSIIINNLLSNALKYSNSKGRIRLSLQKMEQRIQFSIQDYGMGISEQDIAKIFQPFYRSKSIITAEQKGIGLGLSIVKRLCTLLEIEITVESLENQGTTVSLNLEEKA